MEITWEIIATNGTSGRYCQLNVPEEFSPLRAFFFDTSRFIELAVDILKRLIL